MAEGSADKQIIPKDVVVIVNGPSERTHVNDMLFVFFFQEKRLTQRRSRKQVERQETRNDN